MRALVKIPNDYVLLNRALLAAAQAQRPDLWNDTAPAERAAWDRCCDAYDGLFLEQQLVAAAEKTAGMPTRLEHFRETRRWLKEILQDANTFEARCCSIEWYFCSNDDDADVVIIDNPFWCSKSANAALERNRIVDGYGHIPGELLVLVRKVDLAGLLPNDPDNSTLAPDAQDLLGDKGCEKAAPARRQASAQAIRTAFAARVAAWPEGRTHPSEPEDLEALKITLQCEISRSLFRPIRAEIAPNWVKRGRPEKKKTAGR